MRRHDTDVTSLVFGLIFVGIVGLWALVASDTMGLPDLAVLAPALLVVAGFIGLAATIGKSGRDRRPEPEPGQPQAQEPAVTQAPVQEPALAQAPVVNGLDEPEPEDERA